MGQLNPDDTSEPQGEQIDGAKEGKTKYYVQNDESVTEAVIRAVRSVTQPGQTRLEPLYSSVDPDALNALFVSLETGESRCSDGVVAFDYAGKHIQATSEGTIKIKQGGSDEQV